MSDDVVAGAGACSQAQSHDSGTEARHLTISVICVIRVQKKKRISLICARLFVPLHSKNNKIMIVTNNLAVQNQSTKSVSTNERVMAGTMSVDEYFDELISQVHEDYADL